jgi:hypothetical protein
MSSCELAWVWMDLVWCRWFQSVSKSSLGYLCEEYGLKLLSVSACGLASVSKWRATDFNDFKAFLNRARGIFVRTTAPNCSPSPYVFDTSRFWSTPKLISLCFEAFVNRAQVIFVRTVAQQRSPFLCIFVTSRARSDRELISMILKCFWVEPMASVQGL